MSITEAHMLTMLGSANSVLLLEPPYTRLWMPQGLAKISTYVKAHGGNTYFSRATPASHHDLIVVTSLFTYDFAAVVNTLTSLQFMHPNTPVLLGGILATVGADKIQKMFPQVNIFVGISKILDTYVPDYSLDWCLDKKYTDFCWVFTQRGCPNKCGYCLVPRLEPKTYIIPNWREHFVPEKKKVILCDNNISAAPIEHQIAVFEHINEQKKHVDVNAGIDCKHVTPELAKVLGTVKFVPAGLKLAFDRIKEDGVFQEAVELLIANGVTRSAIQAYVLFNYKDTPAEANYRASECRRLKITPYPQQYTPLDTWKRDVNFIGKHWTWNLVRAFRYYWLLRGHYNHMSFDEFLRGNHDKEKSKGKVVIEPYDLEVWEKYDHKQV